MEARQANRFVCEQGKRRYPSFIKGEQSKKERIKNSKRKSRA